MNAPNGADAGCDDGDNTTIDTCTSGECINTPKECEDPGPCETADGFDAAGECLVRSACWLVCCHAIHPALVMGSNFFRLLAAQRRQLRVTNVGAACPQCREPLARSAASVCDVH